MPSDVTVDVTANTRLSRDYNVLSFRAPAVAIAAQPGQFVMIKAAANHDPLLRRPFSIFEILSDEHGRIEGFSILNKRIGPSTRLLYDAKPGDHVRVLGPLGRGFTVPPAGTEAWMVAGGVGLAPFATLAIACRHAGIGITLFYGARHGDELFYLDWFRQQGTRLVLATEDGSVGERGRITGPLDQALSAHPPSGQIFVYACGPEGMLAATASVAARHQRPCEVSVERTMGCGMGGCYSCVVAMRDPSGRAHHVRSCLAGPVLDAAQIVWS